MSNSILGLAKQLVRLEKQIGRERVDIELGIPLFARGRLNCAGWEDGFEVSGSTPYTDVSESRLMTLSPMMGQWGINQKIGPALSLYNVFRGVSYGVHHRNWEFFSSGTDTSTRPKGWARRHGTSTEAFRSGNSIITPDVGATARIRFTGTGVLIIYKKAVYTGKFNIYVDGTYIAQVNTYNAGALYGQTYTIAAGTLSDSEHILQIVNVSDAAETGTNYYIELEGIEILPIVGPTFTNGSPVVTNISDTSQMCVGWYIWSAVSGGVRTIVSIDSETQVTMSGNASASGDNALVVYPPANVNYDVFLNGNNLIPYAWSNSGAGTSARSAAGNLAWYGGYLSRILYPSWRYVGSFRTSAAGYTRFTTASRLVWNMYNRTPAKFNANLFQDHTYLVAAWQAWNVNVTLGQCRIDFIVGLPIEPIHVDLSQYFMGNGAGQIGIVNFGINSVVAPATPININFVNGSAITLSFVSSRQDDTIPASGYNWINAIEIGNNPSVTYRQVNINSRMNM